MRDESVIGKKGISFVIRLWLEPREIAGEPAWRWHVHHVQSGEEASFTRLSDLLQYIGHNTGILPPRVTE